MENAELEPVLNEIIWLTEYAKSKNIDAECHSVECSGFNRVILFNEYDFLEQAYTEQQMMMKIDIRSINKTRIEE